MDSGLKGKLTTVITTALKQHSDINLATLLIKWVELKFNKYELSD